MHSKQSFLHISLCTLPGCMFAIVRVFVYLCVCICVCVCMCVYRYLRQVVFPGVTETDYQEILDTMGRDKLTQIAE